MHRLQWEELEVVSFVKPAAFETFTRCVLLGLLYRAGGVGFGMWRRGLSPAAKIRSRCGMFRGSPVLSSHGCLGGTPHVGQAIANIWLAWISRPIITQFMTQYSIAAV